MSIKQELKRRNIPSLMCLNSGEEVKTAADFEKRREEIKKILQEQEYGYIPEKPEHLRVECVEELPNFCAGKAIKKILKLYVTVGGVEKSFRITSVIPAKEGKHPAFVLLNFFNDDVNRFAPVEEIVDSGFAVFTIYYQNVTSDDKDFKTGIAPLFAKGKRKDTAPGKIAMWAWSAMRVMDYIETLPSIDLDNVAVIGHSRLGKTALVAGGFDSRFKYVISNDSGCSGAAITRGKQGETVPVITNVFPFWFCPRYVKNADCFESKGYDQHFLLALTAPRVLMVGSAEEDLWADPESEFLSTMLASEAFKLYGNTGLVHKNTVPRAKCVLDKGDVLYQVRHGTHYLSREDWQEYIKFIKKQIHK